MQSTITRNKKLSISIRNKRELQTLVQNSARSKAALFDNLNGIMKLPTRQHQNGKRARNRRELAQQTMREGANSPSRFKDY